MGGEDSAQIYFFVGNKGEKKKQDIKIKRCEVMQPKRKVISPPVQLARWC